MIKMNFKFKVLDDGDTTQKWISPRFNNGDWNYYLVLTLTDWKEATGDNSVKKWWVTIEAISPTAAGTKQVKKALDSMGWDMNKKPDTELKVLALAEYGIQATLFSKGGNNKKVLLAEAKKEASLIESFTFGFSMDKPENRIGNTGWDFIRGVIG
jgi:hypothetical protein